MKLDLEEFREIYYLDQTKGDPGVEYMRKVQHTTWFCKPFAVKGELKEGEHFTHDLFTDEFVTVLGEYHDLWEKYGQRCKSTFRGEVSRYNLPGNTPDMTKIPQELTDILKQLPEYVRKVIDDNF